MVAFGFTSLARLHSKVNGSSRRCDPPSMRLLSWRGHLRTGTAHSKNFHQGVPFGLKTLDAKTWRHIRFGAHDVPPKVPHVSVPKACSVNAIPSFGGRPETMSIMRCQ